MNPINALFLGSEFVNTGSQLKKNVSNTMKASNKYDVVLKNNLVKAPKGKGVINAVNANPLFRTASEEIDFLYKVAEEVEPNNGPRPDNARPNRNNYHNNGSRPYYNNRNNNRGRGYRDNRPEQPPMPVNLREINEHRDGSESINPYLLALAAITGAGAIQAIHSKNIKAPFNSAKKGFDKFVHKLPRKILGKNKTIKNVMDVTKEGTKDLREQRARDAKDAAQRAKHQSDMFRRDMQGGAATDSDIYDFLHGKQASLILDELFEKTASLKSVLNDASSKIPPKLKQHIRDDFLREGIGSIPYYATPALAGFVAGKNIFEPAADPNIERVVVDFDLNGSEKPKRKKKISKQASIDINSETADAAKNVANDVPWGQWAKENLPKRALQGLGRSIFPALVIAATGRNIKGRLERLEKKDETNQPIPDGMARVIIETKKLSPEKKASEELEELVLTKLASNALKDAEKKIENAQTEKREQVEERKEKSMVDYNKLKSGMLKKQRMDGIRG